MSKLRVWWIPQVPGKPFYVPVDSLVEARLLLDTLAKYDQFQFENRIKPDYCNTGGLQSFEDDEWTDWYDDDGNEIDDFSLQQLRKKEPAAGLSQEGST